MGVDVQSYSIDAFRALLEKHSGASGALIAQKLASKYYEGYFREMGVATIVVEHPYVDHDYLDDYSAYYVKCFHEYRRHCTRLHFFRSQFDEAEFSNAIADRTSPLREQLAADYVGFLIVRPLPKSVIGRTCVAHYGDDSGRRSFPTAIPLKANVFGIPLAVRTVPFQEQDSVTAACATSSLWSAFQVTGVKFQHQLPSPVEITTAATQRMPLKSRALPNADGLTIEQMAHAIRVVGLEPYYVDAGNAPVLRAAIYAYVSAGIPGLLIFSIWGDVGGKRQRLGLHAAAVTGLSVPSGGAVQSFGHALLKSERMDKIYVHDDQVGPHARMEFLKNGLGVDEMSTSWGISGNTTNIKAVPEAALFPLYNKIRLPLSQPMQDVLRLGQILKALSGGAPLLTTIEWDLRLANISQFRGEVHDWPAVTDSERAALLTKSLPRFLWLATASSQGVRMLDIVFDATDIESGRYIQVFRTHDPQLDAILTAAAAVVPSVIASALEAIMAKVASAA